MYNQIDESDLEIFKPDSFSGFITVGELRECSLSQVPEEPGVYLLLRGSDDEVEFLDKSRGGHFKGKDPAVSSQELERAWIRDTKIMYIGKAGKPEGEANLRSRLRQYISFGKGSATAHWGGRYIWQLADADELIVCWIIADAYRARNLEIQMLRSFENKYGKLPFANLSR